MNENVAASPTRLRGKDSSSSSSRRETHRTRLRKAMTAHSAKSAGSPVASRSKVKKMSPSADELEWLFEENGIDQGPYDNELMRCWFEGGFFDPHFMLKFRRRNAAESVVEAEFSPLSSLFPDPESAFLVAPSTPSIPPPPPSAAELQEDARFHHRKAHSGDLSNEASDFRDMRLGNNTVRLRTRTEPNISASVALLSKMRFSPKQKQLKTRTTSESDACIPPNDERSLVAHLQSYVPEIVMEQVLSDRGKDLTLWKRTNCCVMLADISGFTKLAGQLSKLGDKGSELLTNKINSYFGKMIDIIYTFGGDVVKFAGDALIVVWAPDARSKGGRKRGSALASEKSRKNVMAAAAEAEAGAEAKPGYETNESKPPARANRPKPLCVVKEGKVRRSGVPNWVSDASEVCMQCNEPFSKKRHADDYNALSHNKGIKKDNLINRIPTPKNWRKWAQGNRKAQEEREEFMISKENEGKYDCHSCGRILCRECSCSTLLEENSEKWFFVCSHCYASASKKQSPSEKTKLKQRRAAMGQYVEKSVQCGLCLVTTLDNYEGLRLHVGVGVGEALFLHVGGELNRWEFMVAGDAVSQMGHAEEAAEAGEIFISALGAELLKEGQDGGSVSPSIHVELGEDPNPFAVRRVRGAWLSSPDPPPMWSASNSRLMKLAEMTVDNGKTEAPAEWQNLGNVLIAYVPGAIRNHLKTGAAHFVAEFRRVSVLFVNLPGTDYTRPDIHAELHSTLRTLQRTLYSFEGSMRQFIMDDKGTTLIAVFGLYPFAHENDALIATRCALAMVRIMAVNNVSCKIGVTTGVVYAGTVGNARRCEYAVIGDIVNMSARLMSAAKKETVNGVTVDILCDAETHRDAASFIKFAAIPPKKLKGKTVPMDVFVPIKEIRRMYTLTKMYGNETAMARLQTRAFGLLNENKGSLVVVTGGGGIGKSRLLSELRSYVASHHLLKTRVMTLEGHGEANQKHAPFSSLRSVIWGLLWKDGGTSSGLYGDIKRRSTATAPRTLKLSQKGVKRLQALPLLFSDGSGSRAVHLLPGDETGAYDVVPWIWKARGALWIKVVRADAGPPDSQKEVAALEGEESAASDPLKKHSDDVNMSGDVTHLVLELLKDGSGTDLPIILLDDAQWFDWDSWQFLIQISKYIADGDIVSMIVVAMRPLTQLHAPGDSESARPNVSASNSFLHLVAEPCMVRLIDSLGDEDALLQMGEMNLENSNRYVCELLGTDRIPPGLGNFLYRRAKGNPLYTREVVAAIKQAADIPEVPIFQLSDSGAGVDAAKALQKARSDLYAYLEGVKLESLPLPDTLQGIIRGRIDRLSSGQQMTLKLASIIGESNITASALRCLCKTSSSPSGSSKYSSSDSSLPDPPSRISSLRIQVQSSPRNHLAHRSQESNSSMLSSVGSASILGEAKRNMGSHLDALIEAEFLVLDSFAVGASSSLQEATYSFKTSHACKVAQKLMTFFQRKLFHTKAAQHYEALLEEANGTAGKFQTQEWYKTRRDFFYNEMARAYVNIARHWQKAEQAHKALSYLEGAIMIWEMRSSHSEVVESLEMALGFWEDWRRHASDVSSGDILECCGGKKCSIKGHKGDLKPCEIRINRTSSIEKLYARAAGGKRGSSGITVSTVQSEGENAQSSFDSTLSATSGERSYSPRASFREAASSIVTRVTSLSQHGPRADLPQRGRSQSDPASPSRAEPGLSSRSRIRLLNFASSRASENFALESAGDLEEDPSAALAKRLKIASWLRKLGDAFGGLGERRKAKEYYIRAVKMMQVSCKTLMSLGMTSVTANGSEGLAFPGSETTIAAIYDVMDHCGHCHHQESLPGEANLLEELFRCHLSYAEFELKNVSTVDRALKRTQWVARLAGEFGEPSLLARAHAAVALSANASNASPTIVQDALKRAEEASKQACDPPTTAYCKLVRAACMLHDGGLRHGGWLHVAEAAVASCELFKALGDSRRWELSMEQSARVAFMRGNVWEACRKFKEIVSSSNARHNAELEARAHLGVCMCFRTAGKLRHWFQALDRAEDIVARKSKDVSPGTKVLCAAAVLLQRTLCQVVSPKFVAHVLDLLNFVPVSDPDIYFALCDIMESCAVVLETHRMCGNEVDLTARRHFLLGVGAGTAPTQSLACLFGENLKKVEKMVSDIRHKFRAFSKQFPVAKAAYKRYLGLLCWLNVAGCKQARAAEKWRESVAASEKYDLPLVGALAKYDLGRHANMMPKMRRIASNIFRRLADPAEVRKKNLVDALRGFESLELDLLKYCAAAELEIHSRDDAVAFFKKASNKTFNASREYLQLLCAQRKTQYKLPHMPSQQDLLDLFRKKM